MREPRTLPVGDPTLPSTVNNIITESCYRHLYKQHKKLANHTSHLSFLNTCLRNSFIPNGLRISTVPTVEDEGPGHQVWNEWKRILHRTSILLMQVLKQYHRALVSTYTEEIEYIEGTLKKRSDFAAIKDTIAHSITILKNKLSERKEKKLNILRASSTNRTSRRKSRRKRKKNKTKL